MGLFRRKRAEEELRDISVTMRYAEMMVDIRAWTGREITSAEAAKMSYKEMREKWEEALLDMIERECEKRRRQDVTDMEEDDAEGEQGKADHSGRTDQAGDDREGAGHEADAP